MVPDPVLPVTCSADQCDAPAGWEAWHPDRPAIRPLCQVHAEQVAFERLSANVDAPIVHLAGL